MVFLKWAEKERTDGITNNQVKRINVSKAARRMDAYFQRVNDNRADLKEPLTVDSITAAAKAWDIQITYDEQGHFLWWICPGSLDRDAIQQMDNTDHLRYLVWFSHLVMFDEKARAMALLLLIICDTWGSFKWAYSCRLI